MFAALPVRIGCLLVLLTTTGCLGAADEDEATPPSLRVTRDDNLTQVLVVTEEDFTTPALSALQAALRDAKTMGIAERPITSAELAEIFAFLNARWDETHAEPMAGRRHVEYDGARFTVEADVST